MPKTGLCYSDSDGHTLSLDDNEDGTFTLRACHEGKEVAIQFQAQLAFDIGMTIAQNVQVSVMERASKLPLN